MSFEDELAEDVLEIITVFSAWLYGVRSHKNRKLVETLREVASGHEQLLRAFKTEMDLNNGQWTACARHAGAARLRLQLGFGAQDRGHTRLG